VFVAKSGESKNLLWSLIQRQLAYNMCIAEYTKLSFGLRTNIVELTFTLSPPFMRDLKKSNRVTTIQPSSFLYDLKWTSQAFSYHASAFLFHVSDNHYINSEA
jgi:hypothetical protein